MRLQFVLKPDIFSHEKHMAGGEIVQQEISLPQLHHRVDALPPYVDIDFRRIDQRYTHGETPGRIHGCHKGFLFVRKDVVA